METGEPELGTEAVDREPSAARGSPGERHTSIIYFHGMGTPKRYEELSRVLDTLDRYAEAQADPTGLGKLRGQRIQLETSTNDGGEPIAFIEFFRMHLPPTGSPRRIGAFRLYESYWSPAAAGGVSPLQVLDWVLRRAFNPMKVLASPWRAHQRLKRAFLHKLFFDRQAQPVRLFQALERTYRTFENMEFRRRYPSGRFRVFLQALQAENPRDMDDLSPLAERWRSALVDEQISVVFISAAVFGVLFSFATLAVVIACRLLALVVALPAWAVPVVNKSSGLPLYALLPTGLVLLGIGWSARAFFRNFLSDVVFWTTTFEKDVRYQKRRDILYAAEATVRHVVSDPACERVVLVAHSLGTAIAYETLLNLGRRSTAESKNAAEAPSVGQIGPNLSKLTHLLTFGSPIDRIAYFFNLTYSRYHRFNRVVDDLMGGTGDPPFRVKKARVLQWINIRDPADPIASRLFSPRSRIPNREDIAEVAALSSHVPNPVLAHTGYFDSALGAKILFDACILNRKQIQAQQVRTKASVRFSTYALEVGRVATFLVAFSLSLRAAAFWRGDAMLLAGSLLVLVASLVVLALIWVCGSIFDRLQPLKLPA
jgi:hypothetical protein